MLVASVSYGNDSIALIQWLHENGASAHHGRVLCAYGDTGWASSDWPARVSKAEDVARSYGFEPHRVVSVGFVPLARLKKAWPRNGMQFCTEELKVKPITRFLEAVDPGGEATIAIGIRREESEARSQWPEHVPDSPKHGGRDAWFPLVRVVQSQRDAPMRRAGFEPLPHRSKECFPCINSNRADLRLLTEDRICEIEVLEASMGTTSKGKPRTLFRPYRHGGAVGIREVVRWAHSDRGAYKPGTEVDADDSGSGCDSGFCGS
jgi:3'-phosphoadenosine 5'-phosphosulfate sulfotransferase (PAPS reductase)/FAD synthetase